MTTRQHSPMAIMENLDAEDVELGLSNLDHVFDGGVDEVGRDDLVCLARISHNHTWGGHVTTAPSALVPGIWFFGDLERTGNLTKSRVQGFYTPARGAPVDKECESPSKGPPQPTPWHFGKTNDGP